MRNHNVCIVIYALIIWHCIVIAVAEDLPLSDRISIQSITQYGEATRGVFDIRLEEITYENMRESLLQRIRDGYKADCDCDFDNDFFIQLSNRPILYGHERDHPAVITFSGTYKDGGDPMVHVRLRCKIILSRNKQYAGLIFQQHINTALYHQHFMLVNARGDVQWEMPFELKETLADNLLNRIMFPEDTKQNTYDFCQVSNDGKFVFLRGSMFRGSDGWVLYGSDGTIIKERSVYSLYPVLSDNGEFLLVQENNKSNATEFDYESGTSCYDANTGELLWRKKNILPIQDAGYFISPSGKNIVACCKNRFHEICIINGNGKTTARAGNPQKKRCSSYQSDLHWSPNEKIIFWRKSIIGDSLNYLDEIKPIQTFPDISKTREDELSGVLVTDVVPVDEKYLFAIGIRRTHSFGKTFDPAEKYKFVAILDYGMDFLGISFFETDNSTSTNFRIMVDKKAQKFYVFSDDLSVDVEFTSAGGQK
jgi:hypothetical protein